MSTRYFAIARTDCEACGGKISITLHAPVVVGRECCEVCGCKGYTEKLVDLKDVLFGDSVLTTASIGVVEQLGVPFVSTTIWEALDTSSVEAEGSAD